VRVGSVGFHGPGGVIGAQAPCRRVAVAGDESGERFAWLVEEEFDTVGSCSGCDDGRECGSFVVFELVGQVAVGGGDVAGVFAVAGDRSDLALELRGELVGCVDDGPGSAACGLDVAQSPEGGE
jgi:hypothetical protein